MAQKSFFAVKMFLLSDDIYKDENKTMLSNGILL